MPPVPEPERRTYASAVPRVDRPPVLDAELCYDDQYLYVGVIVGVYRMDILRKRAAWGEDDGAEVAIAGKTPDGKATTFVIRGYPSNTCQSVTDSGAPADAAERLGRVVRFATQTWRRGWRGEWAVSLEALGLKPEPGLKVPFNLTACRSEDEVWRCWEGA